MKDEHFLDPRWKSVRFHVMKLDDFTCRMCSTKGKKLEVHHIIRDCDRPDLAFVPYNLITLCVDCHATVTGKEEQYQDLFKGIAQARLTQEKVNRGGAIKKPGALRKKKWRPRNPRNLY